MPLQLPFPTPLIGIIGGSGLYTLTSNPASPLKHIHSVSISTPWGATSSPVSILSLAHKPDVTFAFLPRHGSTHQINPTEIPARANMAALKRLGCKVVVAFSAVGSLKEEIKPGDVVIPSQLIDRTKGIRPSTYFESSSCVAHASFGEPFSPSLTSYLIPIIKSAISSFSPTPSEPVKLHDDKTLVVMEGPAFSTRAESEMYRLWGGDIIGMTTLPESKLARELEITYIIICTSTDYDAWRPHSAAVSVADVMATLRTNSLLSQHITLEILSSLAALAPSELLETIGKDREGGPGCMKWGIMTSSDKVPEEKRKALGWVLPEYFGIEGTWDETAKVESH